jgi:DNA adenine methylase
MAEALKPPFTYFGGKTAIAERIAALLPPHEHYIEPFGGSLAVLLAKRPGRIETVNDLNGDLMTFWRVLRDRPSELEHVCTLTPHSRAEASAAAKPDPDDLERARRVWVLLTQGRGGHLGCSSGWRYYQDPRGGHGRSMVDYLDSYLDRLAPAAARLRRVSLECRPALEVIKAYGQHEGCLIFADPPYLKSVRTWSNGAGYGHEMASEDEHRELAEALSGCTAAVVLAGYRSPLYEELYAGWHQEEIAASAGNGKPGDRARTEVLWSNRPFPQGSLFDLEAS